MERICSEPQCERRHYARGLCRYHYDRARESGTIHQYQRALVEPGSSLDERLRHIGWDVTAKGCWEWRGCLNGHGYGQLSIGVGRPQIASRVAYEAWVAPIPVDIAVCHTCDNTVCINPDHLFLGTRGDNNRDSFTKRRNANGERKPECKLSDLDVEIIRARYASGGATYNTLATEFGVSTSLIGLIIQGKRRARPTNPTFVRSRRRPA